MSACFRALTQTGPMEIGSRDGRPVLLVRLRQQDPAVHLVRLEGPPHSGGLASPVPWMRLGLEEFTHESCIYRILFRASEAGGVQEVETLVLLGGEELVVRLECVPRPELGAAATPSPRATGTSGNAFLQILSERPMWIPALSVVALLVFAGLANLFSTTADAGGRPTASAPAARPPLPEAETLAQVEQDLDGDGVAEVARVLPDHPRRTGLTPQAAFLEVFRPTSTTWEEIPVLQFREGQLASEPGLNFDIFKEMETRDLTGDGRAELLIWSHAGAHGTNLDVLVPEGGTWRAHSFFTAGSLSLEGQEVVRVPHRANLGEATRYRWSGQGFEAL